MVDFNINTRQEIYWEKKGTLVGGTRVRVIIDNNTILDKTIPLGKKLPGDIIISGWLEDE